MSYILAHSGPTSKCHCICCITMFAGNSSSGHRLCPRGFYCESGTGRNLSACPPGTYSNELGLRDTAECQQCTGWWACNILLSLPVPHDHVLMALVTLSFLPLGVFQYALLALHGVGYWSGFRNNYSYWRYCK